MADFIGPYGEHGDDSIPGSGKVGLLPALMHKAYSVQFNPPCYRFLTHY